MGSRVRFDPVAQAELENLYDFILTQSGSAVAAEGYARRIVERCVRLSEFSALGTRHDHIRPGLRSIGFERRATIAFIVEGEDVTILRIFYGGRDVRTLRGDA